MKTLRILFLFILPTCLFGQGNGATQSEFTSFMPSGAQDFVNTSTGDFSYSIPLFDIGGYPVSLSYSAGRSMDEQASNVGLGWSINTGVITRNKRGLPDDFDGDIISKYFNINRNETYGVMAKFDPEIIGFDIGNFGFDFGASLEATYNNYAGFGCSIGLNANIGTNEDGASSLNHLFQGSIISNSHSGATMNANISISDRISLTANASFSSRMGMTSLGLHGGLNLTNKVRQFRYGHNFDFTSPSYTPELKMPFYHNTVRVNFKTGLDFFGVAAELELDGHRSSQDLSTNSLQVAAYGLMYLHHATDDDLMDINREKDGSIDKDRPNLPLPIQTNDIFNVSAHGFSGSFQMKRGDVGFLHDKHMRNPDFSSNVGVEVGVGDLTNLGIQTTATCVNSQTGAWNDNNDAKSKVGYSSFINDFNFEPVYYTYGGEMCADEDDFFTRIGGDRPQAISLGTNNGDQTAFASLVTTSDLAYQDLTGVSSFFGQQFIQMQKALRRNKREKRNSLIYSLTAKEASLVGVEKSNALFDLNQFAAATNKSILDRVDGASTAAPVRKQHHISEITALKEGGTRFIFGLPAYNIKQVETTFATNQTQSDCNGTISYTANDVSISNNNALDHYFDQVETPAFAHSFMLTEVLSPDYQDLTGDGPTIDDYGQYTKFNYARVSDANNPYRWRTPYNNAEFNPGMEASDLDNKGSIVYGEKEYWYVHSIESKTNIAEFTYTDRHDLYPVRGINGGIDYSNVNPLKKLQKIEIYSIVDRAQNGVNAVPIKVINFEYDYSLYVGVPDNKNNYTQSGGSLVFAPNEGKLTLKKVYSTYENSKKGAAIDYQFTYNQTPQYNAKFSNCWGGYKTYANNFCSDPNALKPGEFPYIDQTHPSDEDLYASMGNLKTIKLPTGGTISVDYESDDYAYVQDSLSMTFAKVVGLGDIGSSTNQLGLNELYSLNSYANHNRVYFRLKQPYTTNGTYSQADAENTFAKEYLREMAKGGPVYIKPYVDLHNAKYDYVPTYAFLEGYGLCHDPLNSNNNQFDIGYIDLKGEDEISDGYSSNGVNPIAKAALQYLRLNLPDLAYGNTNAQSSLSAQFLTSLWNSLAGFEALFENPTAYLTNRGRARYINLNKSFVRLYTPDGIKKGGGYRVKRILMNDRFSSMVNDGHKDSNYGIEYDYSTATDPNFKDKVISSGVSSYEPTLGGEENPLRQPEFYGNGAASTMTMFNRYHLERPYGETFYTSPQVIYSKVKMKKILLDEHNQPLSSNIKQNTDGYTVSEFFTAKDFPTIALKTELYSLIDKPDPIQLFLYSSATDIRSFSQGYSILLNDMHGKPKATYIYNNNNALMSSKEYVYKTMPSDKKRLDSHVDFIHKDNSVSNGLLGLDITMYVDSRSSEMSSWGGTLDFNDNDMLIPFFPPFYLNFPVPFPSVDRAYSLWRALVTVKEIRQKGILEKVIAFDMGAKVETNNIAYDLETGQTVLTNTQNEYNDPVYSLTLPAHWAYKGMQGAYRNILGTYTITDNCGCGINNSTLELAKSSIANLDFTVGDEILNTNNGEKYWVKTVTSTPTNIELKLIGETGAGVPDFHLSPFSNWGYYKIVRSGYRNLASSPIFSLTSLNNPIQNGQLTINTNTKILIASASEYSDLWQHFCETYGGDHEKCYDATMNTPLNSNNLFGLNRLGVWRVNDKWAFIIPRQYGTPEAGTTSLGNDYNVRRDGYFQSFNDFWVYDAGTKFLKRAQLSSNQVPNATGGTFGNWVRTDHSTVISPNGNILETRDALDHYTSQLMGYNKQIVIGTGKNAKLNQVAFDGYEDYFFNTQAASNITPDLRDRHFALDPLTHSLQTIFLHAGLNVNSNNANFGSQTTQEIYTSNGVLLTKGVAHTGNYSLGLKPGQRIDYSICSHCASRNQWSGTQSYASVLSADCGCVPSFSLEPGKYVVSAWVQVMDQNSRPYFDLSYENYANVIVEETGVSSSITDFKPSGTIIEGWQRVYGVVNVNSSNVKITLHSLNTSNNAVSLVLFDDLRIHPFDASFQTFVYDDVSLKLMETLDENNYYTRNEYNQEGKVERIKQETERGVMMIKESRYGNQKKL